MARKNEYIDQVNHVIGIKIQKLRLSRGYTREQLSKRIGISNQQLHKYESGRNIISIGRLVLIAKALNEEISYFCEELNNFNEKPLTTEHQHMCINIANNFMQIKNPEHQAAINSLIKLLAKAA